MTYLKQKRNSRLFLDPTYPLIDKTIFNDGVVWKEFCGYDTKEIHPDVPVPRGKEVNLWMIFDSEHAEYRAT